MRKIEMDLRDAIRAKQNFQSGGTEVVVSDAGNMQVILHGSPIVRIEQNEQNVFINLANWNTVTTRGRINVVLDFYGITRVSTIKGAPFHWNQKIPVNGWVQVRRDGREIDAEIIH